MSACIASTLSESVSSTPLASVEGLLEASIPGFSIFSGIARNYFRIDISALIAALLPIAVVIATIRYSYGPLSSYVMAYGICTAEIADVDDMYDYIMFWVSRQKFATSSRSFLASTRTNFNYSDDWDEDENDETKRDDRVEDWELAEENFEQYIVQKNAKDKVRPLYLTPRDGTHYFKFKGRYLSFNKESKESTFGRYSESHIKLSISCLGRDATILKELLQEAQKMYLARQGSRTLIFRKAPEETDWTRCMDKPPRPLSTVVLDAKQKHALVNDIKEYLHPLTKRWYANRGIPYRRGYLLYGPPGTGKTSLCTAIAGYFGLSVYILSLSSKSLTEDALAQLMHWLGNDSILLLEDVDCAGFTHKREAETAIATTKDDKVKEAMDDAAGAKSATTTAGAGISFSGLLNIIDGVASKENCILMMTTNHVEKLDPALLRPGRVDLSIAFENATTATAEELFKSVYTSREEDFPAVRTGKDPKAFFKRKCNFTDSDVNGLATSFANQIPPNEFSPADIQGYLLKHKYTPKEASEGVKAWIKLEREEHERRKKQATTPDGKRSETPVLV